MGVGQTYKNIWIACFPRTVHEYEDAKLAFAQHTAHLSGQAGGSCWILIVLSTLQQSVSVKQFYCLTIQFRTDLNQGEQSASH